MTLIISSEDKYVPDFMAASVDALAMAMGVQVDRPHPLAGVIQKAGPLKNAALAAGRLAHIRRPGAAKSDRDFVFNGLHTNDFGNALGEAGSKLTIYSYNAQAQHLAFCSRVSARNFHPFKHRNLALDLVPQLIQTGDDFVQGTVESVGGAQDLELTTFGRELRISRELVINEDIDAIAMMFAGFGAGAARLEAKLLADLLESNPVLDDGSQAFNASFGNVVAEAFDASTLGTAIKLLRTQRAPGGQFTNLPLRHLIVEPGLELAASKVLRDVDLAGSVTLTTLADLPAGRWYATGDPTQAPSIGVLRLDGASRPILVGRGKKSARELFEGQVVKAICETGPALVGRVGIVRGGV